MLIKTRTKSSHSDVHVRWKKCQHKTWYFNGTILYYFQDRNAWLLLKNRLCLCKILPVHNLNDIFFISYMSHITTPHFHMAYILDSNTCVTHCWVSYCSWPRVSGGQARRWSCPACCRRRCAAVCRAPQWVGRCVPPPRPCPRATCLCWDSLTQATMMTWVAPPPSPSTCNTQHMGCYTQTGLV